MQRRRKQNPPADMLRCSSNKSSMFTMKDQLWKMKVGLRCLRTQTFAVCRSALTRAVRGSSPVLESGYQAPGGNH
jgi:hypothetical protein